MSFRARLLVLILPGVIVPMVGLVFFIRGEMSDRLTSQYRHRVDTLIGVIEQDIAYESRGIAASLEVFCDAVVEDNRFRRAAVDHAPEERRYLIDYAGHAMTLARLSMLQIQDKTGRIISSGHFRMEFDRMEPALPKLLGSTPTGTALVRARAPEAPFLALARVDSFFIADQRFTVVAGVEVEQRFLARLTRDRDLIIALDYPGGMMASTDATMETTGGTQDPGAITRDLNVPFVDLNNGELTTARFRVIHGLDDLAAMRRRIDRWFSITLAVAVLVIVGLVSWIASRITQPLADLADKTTRLDLDRLDIDFDTGRSDEVGVLSRLLGAMTDRLRTSALLIKDAERRATLGEMARQVNHDIKNGLTPIRNVFRHLTELASNEPGKLPGVFNERRGTLESSMTYLETLASNYARLSSRGEEKPCDVNHTVRQIIDDRRGMDPAVDMKVELSSGAVVHGDPMALRRIFENLIDNAIDSLEKRPGRVTLTTALIEDDSGQRIVRVVVSDTGIGLSKEQSEKVFDDFYTTKSGGTGLGLSIVRRLIMDLGGTIRVESEPGKGSRFIVDLPRVSHAES